MNKEDEKTDSLISSLYEIIDLLKTKKNILNFNLKDFCKSCLYKKNTILLSGKKCSTISYYSNMPVVSSIFGNRFKAVWQEINNNIDKNTSVY